MLMKNLERNEKKKVEKLIVNDDDSPRVMEKNLLQLRSRGRENCAFLSTTAQKFINNNDDSSLFLFAIFFCSPL